MLKRTLFTSLIIAVIAMGILVPSSLAKPLTATCSGTGCNGLDPVSSGCNVDGQTLSSASIVEAGASLGAIQIRYSPSCGTKWARWMSAFDIYFLETVYLKNTSGQYIGGTRGANYWKSAYGPMVYAPTTAVSACAVITDDYGSTAQGCSGYQ